MSHALRHPLLPLFIALVMTVAVISTLRSPDSSIHAPDPSEIVVVPDAPLSQPVPDHDAQATDPDSIIAAAAGAAAKPNATFIEIIDSCGPHFEGACVNVRTAPTSTAPVTAQLRNGIVLEVDPEPVRDETGRTWYEVVFNEWVRYPERVTGRWFVASQFARPFKDPGTLELEEDTVIPETDRYILIDRSEQMLYAYEGDTLFMESAVSTGLSFTPTPRGTFTVFRKTPSRYMQGPLPGISSDYYDLPGVPWDLYFTAEGGAIHGAYWHDSFGQQWSHGCVNLPLDQARKLYEWAPLGITVVVQD